MFSDKLTFRAGAEKPFETPGVLWRGGYYVGRINVDDGHQYAIYVASKVLGGENSSLAWGSVNILRGTSSRNDGKANTDLLAAFGAAAHPAAAWCAALSLGGVSGWYLPAIDEWEMAYRLYKPTTLSNNTSYGTNASSVPPRTSNYTPSNPARTSFVDFVNSASEAFITSSNYLSSTELNANNTSSESCGDGAQPSRGKSFSAPVRAFRRILIS